MDYKTKCLTGEIPRNKRDYQGRVILFHPGIGFIGIAFGTGDDLDQDDLDTKDQNGNNIDDYMYISTYSGFKDLGWYGLCLQEKDGDQLLFSHATYRSGDIRELLEPSLDFMGWPAKLEEYVFISEEDDW